MKKILLVLEDYTELVFSETLLKKIGFNVETSRSEVSLSEKLMTFVPDLVLATGAGSKIEAPRVAKKMRRRNGAPKLIALYQRGAVPSTGVLAASEIDAALEVPASPRTLIAAICQVCQVDLQATLAKFEKLPIAKDAEPEKQVSQYVKSNKTEPEIVGVIEEGDLHIVRGERSQKDSNRVTGDVNASAQQQDENSAERMRKALAKENDQSLGGLPHQSVVTEVKEFREYEKSHSAEVAEIDAARREFVKKLLSND